MKLGRLELKAGRWPWMRNPDTGASYGWGRVPGWGRFGGGWNWKLGVEFGGRTVLVNLLFGNASVSIARKPKT